jgi:orotidine-5'-phosphate decarboxylase
LFDLRKRIIWSADVEDESTLEWYIHHMQDLRITKLDRNFLTDRPLSVILRLADKYGQRVFVDAKIAEIAVKVEAIARTYLKYRPWMLNCMANIVSTGDMRDGLVGADRDSLDALKRFADVCHQVGTLPCAVTVLTNKTEAITQAEYCRPPTDQVLWYLEQLLAAGFTDVVCSPLEVPAIRAESRFDGLSLNTPGIRRVGSGNQDQARVATPIGALEAGATRLVIGRDLTIGDPTANFASILSEITAARIPS